MVSMLEENTAVNKTLSPEVVTKITIRPPLKEGKADHMPQKITEIHLQSPLKESSTIVQDEEEEKTMPPPISRTDHKTNMPTKDTDRAAASPPCEVSSTTLVDNGAAEKAGVDSKTKTVTANGSGQATTETTSSTTTTTTATASSEPRENQIVSKSPSRLLQ